MYGQPRLVSMSATSYLKRPAASVSSMAPVRKGDGMTSRSLIRSLGGVVTTSPSAFTNEMPPMPPRSVAGAPASRALSSSTNTSSPSPLTMTSTSGNMRKVRSAWLATWVPPKITQPSGFICLKVSASAPNFW